MPKYKKGITFGAFEIFHQGHYNLLMNAKKQCDELIVAVSDDDYIRKVKEHEPEIPCELRMCILDSIKCVDRLEKQTLNTGKKELVEFLKPDVIFVGDDWTPETFTGEGLGIPVVYLPRTKNLSSTTLRT